MSKETDQSHSKVEDNFSSTAELAKNTGFQSTLSIASKDVEEQKKPYNPFENRNLEHPNSTLGSIVHLLKACLGSGILAMPAAFKNSGLLGGSIGTLIAGVVCTHAMKLLVDTSQKVCVDAEKPFLGYADTCGATFKYGPKGLRKYANVFKTLVDFSMAATYIGVMCVYIVFIGSSFKEVLDPYTVGNQLSIQMYCALTLVPLVLISQIRNLKYLVPFSLLANALITVVFAITMYYMFSDLPSITDNDRVKVASPMQWPLFFSTVIFAMEGVGVVMPVENEMKHPQRFLGCPGVLNVSMVIVISLYGIFGFFGYLKYGDAVKGSITLNLPQDAWLAQAAQLLMALVIFFSYALQFYVPMEMINRMLANRKTRDHENVIQITIRTVLVAVSVGIAAAFPNLELVISLVGAIFLSTLGILIPAIIDTVYRWERGLGPCNYVLYKNIVLGFISVFALFSGSYTSISAMLAGEGHDVIEEIASNATLF
ncbi:proton-coupled amino acid transporter-like protein CG1139 [Plutella xylostella]|uniref:proton-coupled amino acid transporter-like protein CG1139 n=1 Tax=Plutella xylostella TaxID=51655 RepID=UPI002032495C|nr:proton-coupled amino acid transporter-like protein CG1139 [Plutella xylostella]XP_037967977.2 proton-coupled amino acid transporter-like protein CG1139 [Plutella xylostella]XP_037967979.2 proton-coupled amino acid transporter-like protein CG1139 [Plutella xylostella]